MNIITNRCLGGFLYRDILKSEFKNPFIWTRISTDTFNEIFINFDNIKFDKFEINTSTGKPDGCYRVIIEGKYILEHRHVRFSETDKIPRVVNDGFAGNVYYFDPVNYIKSRYLSRLARMTEEPTFIYMDLDGTKNYRLQDLANNNKKAISILTIDDNFKSSKYVKVIKVEKKDFSKINWWNYLKSKYIAELNELVK